MRLVLPVFLMMRYVYGQIESPCPSVFTYKMMKDEPDRWYGVVRLQTDYTLYGLWLDVILDSKADVLGNWIAQTTSRNNIDFKIEDPNLKIISKPVQTLKFFVKYSTAPPQVQSIRLNGKELCDTDQPLSISPEDLPAEDLTYRSIKAEEVTESPPAQRPIHIPEVLRKNNVESQSSKDQMSLAPTDEALSRVLLPSTHQRNNGTAPQRLHNIPIGYNIEFLGGVYQRDNFNTTFDFSRRPQCGRTFTRSGDDAQLLVVRGRATAPGQWPWQVALYKSQGLNNKYQCGGTLVTSRDVVTAAHCLTHKGSNKALDKYTLSVYLGKHNLRISEEGTQIRLLSEVRVHESFDPIFFSKDIGLVKFRDPVEFTEWVQPACLWPQDQVEVSSVLGKTGSVVGWGFNEDSELNEELNLIEMPVVDEVTCILSKRKFFSIFTSEFTYCAGERNGASVCNGDSGSGMVFKIQDSWYLRGLVSLSVPREDKPNVCDPRHYIVFTDVAKFLKWIKQHITSDN